MNNIQRACVSRFPFQTVPEPLENLKLQDFIKSISHMKITANCKEHLPT